MPPLDEIALRAWNRNANQRPLELTWLLAILKQQSVAQENLYMQE